MPASPRRRKTWAVVGLIIGVLVPFLGYVWDGYGVLGEFRRRPTGAGTGEIRATPYPAGQTEWAVPVSVDFARFPKSTSGCREDQRLWLASAGTRVSTRFLLDMRNTATEGGMLVFRDIGVVGERTGDADPRVLVVCDPEPRAKSSLRWARLDATTERGVAVLSADVFGATSEGLPDTPVVWNLAPGETGQLVVRISSRVPVRGTIAATLGAGRSATRISVEGGEVTAVPLVDGGASYLSAGDDLRCLTESVAVAVDCDPDNPVLKALADG